MRPWSTTSSCRMAAGFNGARLHQKVFEERFLYHADRLGYLVWGEFPDWGVGGLRPDRRSPEAHRHLHHRSGWKCSNAITPTPPSWAGARSTKPGRRITDRITQLDDVTRGMFLAAKAMDTYPPGAGHLRLLAPRARGRYLRLPRLRADPAKFTANHAGARAGKPFVNLTAGRQRARCPSLTADSPIFVSEFGGIWWNPDAKPGED